MKYNANTMKHPVDLQTVAQQHSFSIVNSIIC